MAESQKRIDESWKEQVEHEKTDPSAASAAGKVPSGAKETLRAQRGTPSGREGMPEARFDLFISGLSMEALVALGDMPHPVTRKQDANLVQAKYLIDLLGIIEQKSKGNRSADEDQLLTETLYQLRMRYLSKSKGASNK